MERQSGPRQFIYVFILIACCSVFSRASVSSKKVTLAPLKPLQTDNPPVIDGVLDDPIWGEAPYETGSVLTWIPSTISNLCMRFTLIPGAFKVIPVLRGELKILVWMLSGTVMAILMRRGMWLS